MTSADTRRHRSSAVQLGLLALAAYVPALASSPGRMPADTKLYLYLDPGGLIGRAASTFEPNQFAGWVPHQQITYLWPSGPWFWSFEAIGVPDWIAHRLWIATIMFAAGSGAWWALRRLGLSGPAVLAGAAVYQLSPFLLPYVSRTSVLLLPWAGLGWIVGLTAVATARAADTGTDDDAGWRTRLTVWREPSLIAVIVATVGSANATALVLIAPAPVLWLVHVATSGRLGWRPAVAIAARTAVTCTAVSLWWAAMVVVQSRHGAPVLSYSETLADVSRNSTGSEVVRSLGYWLFYVRDPFGPTTTASFDYLASTRTILVSYVVVVVGLLGIAVTTSPLRRFAALLAATAVVLAVGVHPIDDPSPLMSLIADDDGSGIALALRSSTRALPMFALALALGAALLVRAVPDVRMRPAAAPGRRAAVAAIAVAIAGVNMPSVWQLDLVDPAIDRDQDPPRAWIDGASALGSGGGRVLQLPGAEFGAFRWGYTVDQPLAGLTDVPLVTRDLLPLGEAGAMDLLYALDDRFQEGTIEPAAVAPVARLLGADTVWVANDIEFERFRTARPEIAHDELASAPGLTPSAVFGTPEVNSPTVPMIEPISLADERIGTPLAPVVLHDVDTPGAVIRAKTAEVLVAGSGDGLVDLAAAGSLAGTELVRYTADLDDGELSGALAAGVPLMVTDSNRDRAHHWRGSQDVVGHTEPGGPGDDVLVPTAADQRLAVFATDDPATQTVAEQDGPVTAIASSYGEPFAYLPEHRAVLAIDGDLSTAWLVGGHGDPVGERIRLTLAETTPEITVHQPAGVPGHEERRIAAIRVTTESSAGSVASFEVELSEASWGPDGQTIPLAPAGDDVATLELEITALTAVEAPGADAHAAVGFAEIDTGLGATTEWIRTPVRALAGDAGGPLSIVLNRLRVDPFDRWRTDPEPELLRRFDTVTDREMTLDVTLRLDRRTADAVLSELVGTAPDVALADRRLTGAPDAAGWSALDGDLDTSWITPFDRAVGSTLSLDALTPTGPELEIVQPVGSFDTITAVAIDDGTRVHEVDVPAPGADGRSTVSLPSAVGPGRIAITIARTAGVTTIDRRFGDPVGLPAAIAEVRAAGIETVPIDPATPVARRCTDDLLVIDGTPVPLSFETTVGALLAGAPVPATACGDPLSLSPGSHTVRSVGRTTTGLTIDRVVMSEDSTTASTATTGPDPAVTVERDDTRHRTVVVTGCDEGCWLVHGEGFNDAWSASADGVSLGSPRQVDGGFNGWWLEASDGPITIDIRWTAQRAVTAGLVVSVLAVLGSIAVVVLTWRRSPPTLPADVSFRWRRPTDRRRVSLVTGATLTVAATILIGPVWGLVGLLTSACAVLLVSFVHSPVADRFIVLLGPVLVAVVGLATVVINRRDRPLPTAGWTESFESLNGWAVFAVLALAAGTLVRERRP